jgi:hypothetical protein
MRAAAQSGGDDVVEDVGPGGGPQALGLPLLLPMVPRQWFDDHLRCHSLHEAGLSLIEQ